jgi:ABC-2 type transport system permease protein
MTELVRAELLKLRTLRTFWWTIGATIALVPLTVAITISSAGRSTGLIVASLDSTEGFRNVIAASASGGILMVVIGIYAVTNEFRFNTVTATFLVTPKRSRVVQAKLIATTIVGIAVGVAATALCLAVALPWLSARDVSIGSHIADIIVVVCGGIAATALSGVVGVGIGALVVNQTLAVVVTLLWMLFLENLLTNVRPGIGRWFPGGAVNAMSGITPAHAGMLPVWGAALLLIGYAGAFAALGSRFVVQRDIT